MYRPFVDTSDGRITPSVNDVPKQSSDSRRQCALPETPTTEQSSIRASDVPESREINEVQDPGQAPGMQDSLHWSWQSVDDISPAFDSHAEQPDAAASNNILITSERDIPDQILLDTESTVSGVDMSQRDQPKLDEAAAQSEESRNELMICLPNWKLTLNHLRTAEALRRKALQLSISRTRIQKAIFPA